MTAYQTFLLLWIKTGLPGGVEPCTVPHLQKLHQLGLIDSPSHRLGLHYCRLTEKGERVTDAVLAVGRAISE